MPTCAGRRRPVQVDTDSLENIRKQKEIVISGRKLPVSGRKFQVEISQVEKFPTQVEISQVEISQVEIFLTQIEIPTQVEVRTMPNF